MALSERLLRARPLLVAFVPPFPWRYRGGVFVGVFGGVWLLVGPIADFAPALGMPSASAPFLYGLCLVVSVVAVVFAERYHRGRLIRMMDLVDFEVLLTSTGLKVPVRAPKDMAVRSFVDQFLDLVSQDLNPHPSLTSVVVRLYRNNLLLIRNGRRRRLSETKTLHEVGVTMGDICMIAGYIRKEFEAMQANILGPAVVASIRRARAEGKAYTDEDVAVNLEEARTRGIITQSGFESLRDGAHPGTEFFVVNNLEGAEAEDGESSGDRTE